MSMKFKVGQVWKTRDGKLATISTTNREQGRKGFPIGGSIEGEEPIHPLGETPECWTEEGSWWETIRSSPKDLVELIPSPVVAHDGKDDSGKVDLHRFDMYFPRVIEAVSRVLEFGAEKYGDSSWVNVPNGQRRYQAASKRHKIASLKGQLLDPESGMDHRFHKVCNDLMVLELHLREIENED